MPTNIRALEQSDHTLIGRIIADAFADDPVNLWAFGGTDAMLPSYTAMARHLFLKRGFGHVTTDGNAGTLWLPPGVVKGYGAVGNTVLGWHILRRGGLTAVRHSTTIDAFLRSRFPRTPHYYLFAIAVDPALQGTGMGSALMKETLARVDRDHMPAYLENSKPRNTPFYEKHGFHVVEEVIPGPGCPPMWLMWRDPR
jgi:GNAT superfamily N-acetyltransferase